MNEVINLLNKYEFFKGKNFQVFGIQDYGRKSKFKVEMDKKYYTVLITEKRISPYVLKLEIFGQWFQELIGFQYLSEDKKILVLDYPGNNKGLDLVKLQQKYTTLPYEDYSNRLKKLLDEIHATTLEYVDFSKEKYSSWREYYLKEISEKIDKIYQDNLIDEKTWKELLKKLEESSQVYLNFKPTLIHADVTPLNVCVNIEEDLLYLIDYDDFKIGDPIMDISRIINFKNTCQVFRKMVDKFYSNYEDNINHLFYTLRVNVNWYYHIIEKKQESIYDLGQAKKEILMVIEQINNKMIDEK